MRPFVKAGRRSDPSRNPVISRRSYHCSLKRSRAPCPHSLQVKDLERSIKVIGGQLAVVQMLIDAMIVECIRTNSIDETEFVILLEKGMSAFQNNTNMSNQETFGAIGTITSLLDIIERAKDAKIRLETA